MIVATWEPHEKTVLETIRDCGLELQVIFNKGAVMVLPAGVNKATGLRAALAELNLSPHNAVGVGDAENDHAFLSICECSVAVANALPAVKDEGGHRHVRAITAPASPSSSMKCSPTTWRAARAARSRGTTSRSARTQQGKPIGLSPFRASALVVGTSGGGKSTVVAGLVERLRAANYNFCIIDPEGDYDSVESAVVLGKPEHAPTVDECLQLLSKPDQNAVINLLGVKLDDRPWFFLSLFARIRELRARTGRPHWLIVDEAHHAMPANWRPTDQNLPERLEGVADGQRVAEPDRAFGVARAGYADRARRQAARNAARVRRRQSQCDAGRERAGSARVRHGAAVEQVRRTCRRRSCASSRAARSGAGTCANTPKASCRKTAASISAGPRESSTCARTT